MGKAVSKILKKKVFDYLKERVIYKGFDKIPKYGSIDVDTALDMVINQAKLEAYKQCRELCIYKTQKDRRKIIANKIKQLKGEKDDMP